MEYGGRKFGKTMVAVEHSKFAQSQGKTVFWATNDQVATAALLSRHGALSEIVGEHYVRPVFRKAE